MNVEGKAAVITGGGTGVGRATSLDLARRGCAVLVNYSRSKDEAEQTAAEAAALGVKAIAVQADVADDADCRRMIDTAVREFGRLDVLVNNAGITTFIKHDDLEAVQLDDWMRLLSTNLIGAFQCARAARAALEASGNGEIVNVSSVAGVAGTGSSIPYCASKAALNNMTVTLARVFAPTVRVNAIQCGPFLTDIATHWDTEVVEQLGARASLGRCGEPGEILGAALYLAGEDSSFCTGAILRLDGGVA